MAEIKLIIAGGRDFNDAEKLSRVVFALAEDFPDGDVVSIVSGMAKGADRLGYEFAKANHVKCYEFPANWRPNGVYNPGAGFIRNREMGRFADHLLAFHDGASKGTAQMIEFMKSLGKPVTVVSY